MRFFLDILPYAVAIFLYFWLTKKLELRQVAGKLSVSEALNKAACFPIGEFQIDWEPASGGRLVVRHSADLDRALWATLPGQTFIGAAFGQESVKESRGLFKIKDRRRVVFTRQSIDQIKATEKGIEINGMLKRLPYTLRFQQVTANRLHFEIEVAPQFNRCYLTYASTPDEHFFGFGEQFSFVDMKGKRLPLFVMEQGVGRGQQPITLAANISAGAGGSWHTTYAGVPQYITSKLNGFYLDNNEYSIFDMSREDRVQVQLFAPLMQGNILFGESPAELIAAYTAAVGRMRPLPEWILDGAVVGLQGGTQKVREIYAKLQTHDTPLAAIWLQDWVGQRTTSFGKQLWWNWLLDREHYPEWETLVSDLAADDVRMMTYTNPFLVDMSANPNVRRNLFVEAKEAGYLVKRTNGNPHLVMNTDFAAGLLDLTNPDAVTWMKDIIREELIAVGASGWMADFGEALPWDAVLYSGEKASSYHNHYPVAWAQLNREVVDAEPNGDKLVFFSRSGFRESPAHTTLFWEGDQMVTWDEHDGLKSAVTGLLSSGFSGFAFNHSDIGGYTAITHPILNVHRSKELLLRWMELSAFTVVYRSHEGNQPDENVQLYQDEETLAHFARMAKVYAAWGFYRKQLVKEAAQTGLPVVRHPFIHYPDDASLYTLTNEQFMVGSDFIIAPVTNPETSEVSVYLPAGKWVHLWHGESYGETGRGTTVTVPAPLGQPGVFYRSGSLVGEEFRTNLSAENLLD